MVYCDQSSPYEYIKYEYAKVSKWNPSTSVYMCIYMCVRMNIHVSLCVHAHLWWMWRPEINLWIHSLNAIHQIFWCKSSHWLKRPFSSEITCKYIVSDLFLWLWRWNSGPHTRGVSFHQLNYGLSPQTQYFFFAINMYQSHYLQWST